MDDFFQEGATGDTNANVYAPQKTPEQLRKEEEMRIYANFQRGLDANGNPLPAYGTARSQGGTATGYNVTRASTGMRDGGPFADKPNYYITTGLPGEGAEGYRGVRTYVPATSPAPTGAVVGRQAAPNQAAGAPGFGTSQQVSGDLAVAQGLAEQALGTQPTVEAGHQVNATNRDALTPVIDPLLERNAEVDRAFAMSEDLVNRILNAPSQTGLIADRMLSNQLALARSTPGGIGGAQGGIKAAMGAAPQIQQQAAMQSLQEQQTRAQAATGAAQIYAGVAGSTADRAVRIQEANQQAASNVLNNLTQLTGQDYAFDAQKMQTIGQLARDYFNNAQAFANMDTQRQIAQWNDMTQRYGIDQNFKAAMEQIAAQESIGPLDALKMVLGGATAVGALV